MFRGRSKYPSIGILDCLERWSFGGVPKFNRGQLFKKISKEWPIERGLFSKRLNSLKRSGLIEYVGDGYVTLTVTGTEKVNFYRLENLSITKKKDGQWRIVIFDIPEKKKYIRKILRDKLIEFDFYQLQKSVYVTPFICEKEIAELARILEIRENVDVIKASELGDREKKIQAYFRE